MSDNLPDLAAASTSEVFPQPDEPSQPAPVESQSATQPQPSYVKLAMRNMVRKRRTSLLHFALTTGGLLAVLVGLAYLTR
jgi:hypothetical protein